MYARPDPDPVAEETWECSRCGRESREGEALALWELIDDGSDADPEDMPVVCPECFYTLEELDQIREALRHTSREDAVVDIVKRLGTE